MIKEARREETGQEVYEAVPKTDSLVKKAVMSTFPGRHEVPRELEMRWMIWMLHVGYNCVNCGQCENACYTDIPVSKLAHNLSKISSKLFGYDAGSLTDFH